MPIRKTNIGAKKPVGRAKRPAITAAKIMSIYADQVRRNSRRPAKSVAVSQRNFVLGTSNDWSNARVVDRNPAWVNVEGAQYVWSRRDLNSQFAVISERFRLNRDVDRGRLFLSVDNYAVALVNGRIVVYDSPQATTSFFDPGRTFDITRFLRRGQNDIVIIAFNSGGGRSNDNPAGVAARLNIRMEN